MTEQALYSLVLFQLFVPVALIESAVHGLLRSSPGNLLPVFTMDFSFPLLHFTFLS